MAREGKVPPGFDPGKEAGKEKRKATEYANDKEKTEHLLNEAFAKAERNKGSLRKVWGDLMALFRMVSAWARGKYTAVPWRSLVLAIVAIVYFVNPFDVIPDFVPVVGYVDDAAVVAAIIASIRDDVQDFVEWERRNRA